MSVSIHDGMHSREKMVVAIDGPAGVGKSSVTRVLAERIGFAFLDTGAMYRAIAFIALQRGVDLRDDAALTNLATNLKIRFNGDQVFVDNDDVTERIRTPKVTRNVVYVADSVGVRQRLVEMQREIAETGDFVCEGRDQGTVAFPDAFCKIFLTASPQLRATRRAEQLEAAGRFVDFDQVLADQTLRDKQDSQREFGGLRRADDAVEVNTDHKTIDEVVNELERVVKAKMAIVADA